MERDNDTGLGKGQLRLAIPSDGELHEPTLRFLESCGLPVERPSARRYTGEIRTLPGTVVLFQRTADITPQVEEGSADLGIVGLDRFLEFRKAEGKASLLVEDLGFGRCELVIGVPEVWIDVTSMADLADLALEFREKGRELRIATKYPRLVQSFLLSKGIHYFSLIPASGTLEAAPATGYADIIADISATGATLRENRLKTLPDGLLLTSQACLIGNRELLEEPAKRPRAQAFLELVQGHLKAQEFYFLQARYQGTSPQALLGHIKQRPDLLGRGTPSLSRVEGEEGTYLLSLFVEKGKLPQAIAYLRQKGPQEISVLQPVYLLGQQGPTLDWSGPSPERGGHA